MTAQGLARKSQIEAKTIIHVILTIYEWLLYRVNTQIETSSYVHKVHWEWQYIVLCVCMCVQYSLV